MMSIEYLAKVSALFWYSLWFGCWCRKTWSCFSISPERTQRFPPLQPHSYQIFRNLLYPQRLGILHEFGNTLLWVCNIVLDCLAENFFSHFIPIPQAIANDTVFIINPYLVSVHVSFCQPKFQNRRYYVIGSHKGVIVIFRNPCWPPDASSPACGHCIHSNTVLYPCRGSHPV